MKRRRGENTKNKKLEAEDVEWFVTKSDTKKSNVKHVKNSRTGKTSTDDDWTESYEESVSEKMNSVNRDYLEKANKERAHKILHDIEKGKHRGMDYTDIKEEFKNITSVIGDEARAEIDFRILNNAPKDATPGSPQEYFYGCAIPQYDSIDNMCVPTCVKGYPIKGNPSCQIPVYELKDGDLSKLNKASNSKAYLYVAFDDIESEEEYIDHIKYIKKKENVNEVYIYHQQQNSSQYAFLRTEILDSNLKGKRLLNATKTANTIVEDTRDDDNDDSKYDNNDKKDKCKKEKCSDDSSFGGGIIFAVFIFFIIIIVIILIFWVIYNPSTTISTSHKVKHTVNHCSNLNL